MAILADIINKPLIERDVLPQITKWIPKKEAIILLGSRQVGKTCLLYLLIQHIVKNKEIALEDIFYFDLERLENLEMLNAGVDNLVDFINHTIKLKIGLIMEPRAYGIIMVDTYFIV